MKGLGAGEPLSFSELFLQRPVATTILMLALVLFGLVAYTRLPVAELPNVDFPTISVSASLPGADPEPMAATVKTRAAQRAEERFLSLSASRDPLPPTRRKTRSRSNSTNSTPIKAGRSLWRNTHP